MTYGELLDCLQKFSASDLEKTVQVLVTGQALVIHRIDEDYGVPVLETGVHHIDPWGACE